MGRGSASPLYGDRVPVRSVQPPNRLAWLPHFETMQPAHLKNRWPQIDAQLTEGADVLVSVGPQLASSSAGADRRRLEIRITTQNPTYFTVLDCSELSGSRNAIVHACDLTLENVIEIANRQISRLINDGYVFVSPAEQGYHTLDGVIDILTQLNGTA